MNWTLGLHDGRFHADDVMVAAALRLYSVMGKVIRTRDPVKLAACNIVADIGKVYDPTKLRFDHHQPGGAGKRPNGIEYSSIGLIWKDLVGETICGSKELADLVDSRFIQTICARDTGGSGVQKANENGRNYTFGDIVHAANPTDDNPTPAAYDRAFRKMVKFAMFVLKNEIATAAKQLEGQMYLRDQIRQPRTDGILVLDRFCQGWPDVVRQKAPDVKFVVFKTDGEGSGWRVAGVGRKMPAEWHGKGGADLEKLVGVPDLMDCHNNGYQVGAKTRAAAVAVAHKLVQV